MKILIINNDDKKVRLIRKFLKLEKCDSEVVNYKRCKKHVDKDISGLIISGSPHHATITMPYEKDLILDAVQKKIPVLGICGGHQVLGLLFGGKVGNHKKPVKGYYKIKFMKRRCIFNELPEKLSIMFESHRNYVTLPKSFELLGTSTKTKNEAMKMKRKSVYGVQFHPEMSGYLGEIIFKNFCNICKVK
ncbi:MAG: gamma-glutamyl-gamma-aminobutyrate hydrolase family protein [Nanoarchaeota archaeon]|nr:gamma-glutamyl-gamma-aminobutyrate hydrolase family protein [Nanoarchaeota archaeon]